MLNFILRRCLLALAVALAVSILTFGLLRLSGDTAHELAGANATAADVQKLRKAYGLDKPLWTQYGQWAGRVARGEAACSAWAPSSLPPPVSPVPSTVRSLAPTVRTSSSSRRMTALCPSNGRGAVSPAAAR